MPSLNVSDMQAKGIVHAHSNHSYDGKLTLAELRARLIEQGLQFACMTEHSDNYTPEQVVAAVQDCRAHSDEAFLFISGFEVPFEWTHTLVIGAETLDVASPALETIRKAKDQGAWIVLAHPHRNNFQAKDTHAAMFDAVEVWNSHYDGKRAPRMNALAFFRHLKASNNKLLACAGLDFHRESHFGGPHLTLEVDALSEQAVVEKLRLGQYRMEHGSLSLPSDGSLTSGQRAWLSAVSGISVASVSGFKKLSSALTRFGVPQPKKIKAALRRWL